MNTIARRKLAYLLMLLCLAPAPSGYAQQAQGQPPPTNTQKLPDAPRPQPGPAPAPPPAEAAPAQSQPAPNGMQPPAEPPANVQPYQPAPQEQASYAPGQLYTIIKTVNAVVVPVVVKDRQGNLVQDLEQRDFTILENGAPQPLTFFSSDPFPISAAVVIDDGMSTTAFEKVKKTLPALIASFGQFDEVALWIYGETFKKVHDFTALTTGTELDATVQEMRAVQGEPAQPAVGTGPIDSPPTVNGRPVDIRNQNVNIYNNPQTAQAARAPSKVLNDALLAAAQDLGKRPPQNHRIVFVISDGREGGSRNSYADVVKVLNSSQMTVFGIDVSSSPILGRLERSRIPRLGGAYVLKKFADATGGEVFNDFSTRSIEEAYNTLAQDARNQYTLAYASHAGVLAYRDIDVRVARPGCKQHPSDPGCVWVYAREGYYPLPPARQ